MQIHKKIINATEAYYHNTLDYLKLTQATKEYKNILEEICQHDMNTDEGRNDIAFENGKALGTFWAALCLDDIIRTRQFIRGIDKAVKDQINTSNKPIHILYAGTGPFATLILPIMLRHSKEKIKYTLLEINPLTFELLQKVISKIGLENYDITYANEDATQYKLDPENQPHIIISETMQNALDKEQQVPVFLNLMRQASKEAVFIPEKINIHIGLKEANIPSEKLHKKHYHPKDKVLEISKDFLFSFEENEKFNDIENLFKKKETTLKKEQLVGFNDLVLITDIQVYKDEKIGINESGLTTPRTIKEIPDNVRNSIIIDSHYKISSEPKLEYDITIM